MPSRSYGLYLLLLCVVGVERLFELRRSRRNARAALAHGGREYGAAHFPWMVAMHTSFLFACAAEPWLLQRTFPGALGWVALYVSVAAQGLRAWVVATLGGHWNVRIIVVPGASPVTGGPYRYLRHPNYLAVVLEVLALPLVHGAYLTAVVYSVLNALMLRTRIAAEEAALGEQWQAAFGGKSRLLPWPVTTSETEVARS